MNFKKKCKQTIKDRAEWISSKKENSSGENKKFEKMETVDEQTIEDAQSITVQEVREEINDGRPNIESSFEISVVARTTKRIDMASEPTNFAVGELESTKLRLDKTKSGTVKIDKKDRDANSEFIEVVKYNHAKFQVLEAGSNEINLTVHFDTVESLAEKDYIMNVDSKLDQDQYGVPDHDEQEDMKPNPLYAKRGRVKDETLNDSEPDVEDGKPPLRQPVRKLRAVRKGTVPVQVAKLEAMQEAVNELKEYLDDSIVGRDPGQNEPAYDSSETSD